MQVVYIDSLFFLNVCMDYLLLLATARLGGYPLQRGRLAAAALLGGGYAAAACLPGMVFLSTPLWKAVAAMLMVWIGLGTGRGVVRKLTLFFILAFAFGGGVMAVAFVSGRSLHPANGFLFRGPDLKIILLTAAICYVAWSIVLKGIGRKSVVKGELVKAEIAIGEKQIDFTALHDTGNTLTDPVSGRGVLVLDWETALPLIESECALRDRELADPGEAVSRLNTGRWRGRWGLIAYRAVGVEHGMLLTLRPDRVRIAGKEMGRMPLALSPTPVSPGGGWHGLVGDDL